MSIENLELTERMRYKPDGQIMISADHQLRLVLSHWIRKALDRGWEPLTPHVRYTDQWISVEGGCETDPQPMPHHREAPSQSTFFNYRTRRCEAKSAIASARKVPDEEIPVCTPERPWNTGSAAAPYHNPPLPLTVETQDMGSPPVAEWVDRAACVGCDPHMFTCNQRNPTPPKDIISVCYDCPVRLECLTYALSHHSIYLYTEDAYGGTTPAVLRCLKRGRTPEAYARPCRFCFRPVVPFWFADPWLLLGNPWPHGYQQGQPDSPQDCCTTCTLMVKTMDTQPVWAGIRDNTCEICGIHVCEPSGLTLIRALKEIGRWPHPLPRERHRTRSHVYCTKCGKDRKRALQEKTGKQKKGQQHHEH